MTDAEKRAHDLTIVAISKKDINDLQDWYEEYESAYYMLYNYVKMHFVDE